MRICKKFRMTHVQSDSVAEPGLTGTGYCYCKLVLSPPKPSPFSSLLTEDPCPVKEGSLGTLWTFSAFLDQEIGCSVLGVIQAALCIRRLNINGYSLG